MSQYVRCPRFFSLQAHVAAWADRRLIPVALATLLAMDAACGLIWIVSPPTSFASPVFDTAKGLLSIDAYGLAMLFAVFAAVAGFAVMGRCWITGWLAGPVIAGQWVFWCVLFTAGAMHRPGASFMAAVFAAAAAVLHLLAGLAVAAGITLGDRRPQRRRTDPKR